MSTIFRSRLKAIDGTQLTLALKAIDPGVDAVDENESFALLALYELAPPESTLRRELSWTSICDAAWAQTHALGIVTACHWEGAPREGLLHLTLSDVVWADGLRVGAKAESTAFLVADQLLPSPPLHPNSGKDETRDASPAESIWLPREVLLRHKPYTQWDLVPPVLHFPALAREAYTVIGNENAPHPEALLFHPVWLREVSDDEEAEFGVLWWVDEDSLTLVSISGSSASLRVVPRQSWLLQPALLKAHSHAHRMTFEDCLQHTTTHLLQADLNEGYVTLTLSQNEAFEAPNASKALTYLLAVNDTFDGSFDFKPLPSPLTDALKGLLRQHKLNWQEELKVAVSYGAHAWVTELTYENQTPSLTVEALLELPERERLARWREVQHRQILRFKLQPPDLAAHLRDMPLPRPLTYISALAFPLPPQPAPKVEGPSDAYAFFWWLKGKTQRAMRELETHHSRVIARFGRTLSDQRLKRAGYEAQPEALRETFASEAEAQAAFEARCLALLDAGYYQAPSPEICASYLREHLKLELDTTLTIQALLSPEEQSDFSVGAILKTFSGDVLSVEALTSLEELYSLVRVSEGRLYLKVYRPDSDSTKLCVLEVGTPEPLPKPKKRKAK